MSWFGNVTSALIQTTKWLMGQEDDNLTGTMADAIRRIKEEEFYSEPTHQGLKAVEEIFANFQADQVEEGRLESLNDKLLGSGITTLRDTIELIKRDRPGMGALIHFGPLGEKTFRLQDYLTNQMSILVETLPSQTEIPLEDSLRPLNSNNFSTTCIRKIMENLRDQDRKRLPDERHWISYTNSQNQLVLKLRRVFYKYGTNERLIDFWTNQVNNISELKGIKVYLEEVQNEPKSKKEKAWMPCFHFHQSPNNSTQSTRQDDAIENMIQRAEHACEGALPTHKQTDSSTSVFQNFYKTPIYSNFVKVNEFCAKSIENSNGDDASKEYELNQASVFLGQVAYARPQFLTRYLKNVAKLSFYEKGLLLRAVRVVGLKHAAVKKFRSEQMRKLIYGYNFLSLEDVRTLQVKEGMDLDLLWRSFFATSDRHYLQKILEVLNQDDEALLMAYELSNREFIANTLTNLNQRPTPPNIEDLTEHIRLKNKQKPGFKDLVVIVKVAMWSIDSNIKSHPEIQDLISKIIKDSPSLNYGKKISDWCNGNKSNG